MIPNLGSWLARLHGGQVVMLLLASAVASVVLVFVGLASFEAGRYPRASVKLVTNYDSFSRNHEDTLPAADLWEMKRDGGFSEREATVYTALSPSGSARPDLADSARGWLSEWKSAARRASVKGIAAWALSAASMAFMWLALWHWLGARKKSSTVDVA